MGGTSPRLPRPTSPPFAPARVGRVMRLLRAHPGMKAVYIAPLKALVRERMADWGRKFVKGLGYKMEELTGDVTPDARALLSADILTTTPEKWDGVSRHWQQRSYVRNVGLIIIDEIHLLGEDRGPILEVIVSRMRYISTKTAQPVRIVGLSTAMANAHDLAEWLGIPADGLYNFKPSVRPVPLEVHIAGFPGKHYCPRMATMNKPTYRAILNHSPDKPTLVFVSSRRQTRLTALDLIAFCSADERESQFVNMTQTELEPLLATVKDQVRLSAAVDQSDSPEGGAGGRVGGRSLRPTRCPCCPLRSPTTCYVCDTPAPSPSPPAT